VTRYEGPSRTIPDVFGTLGMSRDRLVVSLADRTSNVWMVENVDR
jgi:hypothetical protein